MPEIGDVSTITRKSVEQMFPIGRWFEYTGLLREWKGLTVEVTGHVATGVKGKCVRTERKVFIPESQFNALNRVYSIPVNEEATCQE